MSAVLSAPFFDRLHRVATTPVDLIEGGLWGWWFGRQVNLLRDASEESVRVERLPSGTFQKASKLWDARKKVFLQSATTISAASFFVGWLGEVKLLHLGSFQPLISGLAYLGTAVTSPFFLWDALKAFNETSYAQQHAPSASERHRLALFSGDHLLNVAMLVCFSAWGILGLVYSATGVASLYPIVDKAFLYGALMWLVRFGYAIFFLPSKKSNQATPAS